MTNFTGDVVAMAQRDGYNPWSLPESFTLYNYAPDDIKGFLHPHWHSMQALHPMWYYVIGLVYLVVGKYCWLKKISCRSTFDNRGFRF